VLSTFFGLLALGTYAGYGRRPSIGRYLMVFTWLALSLMSKPMLVTLPFVFLLLDFWPLGRFSLDRRHGLALVVEKLPLIALVAAASCATLLVFPHYFS